MGPSSLTSNQWAEALQRALSSSAEQVPDGFETREQIGAKMGLKMARTREVLSILLASGQAERAVFRVITGNCVRPIPHYRLKAEKKTQQCRVGNPKT